MIWWAGEFVDAAAFAVAIWSAALGWSHETGFAVFLAVMLATVPWSAWLRFRLTRQVLRLELPGRCRGCGYDLTGNVSGTCPECGAASTAKGDA